MRLRLNKISLFFCSLQLHYSLTLQKSKQKRQYLNNVHLIPSFPVLFLTQVSPATLALLFILVNRCILALGDLHMLF